VYQGILTLLEEFAKENIRYQILNSRCFFQVKILAKKKVAESLRAPATFFCEERAGVLTTAPR
jgi:hypothetical protein